MIQETVTSVLSQTFSNFELIIINDGSTDSTLDIISSINDSRIKVFSYPNGNQAVSRNRGMTHAKGEYIAFLDADDLWTPDKLEIQYQALQDNPEAAVAYSWTDCIDESSQFLRPGSHMTVNGDTYPYLLLVNILENGSNPLIRRHALEAVGEFDSSLPPAEDWDMGLRLAKHYQFVAVPKVQILYRQYDHSMSMNVQRLEKVTKVIINREFAEASNSIKPLKKHSLANNYKYLIFKSLGAKADRKQGLVALGFLYHLLLNEPEMLKKRITIRTLLKILTFIILSEKQAEWFLSKFGRISNIGGLIMTIQNDPT